MQRQSHSNNRLKFLPSCGRRDSIHGFVSIELNPGFTDDLLKSNDVDLGKVAVPTEVWSELQCILYRTVRPPTFHEVILSASGDGWPPGKGETVAERGLCSGSFRIVTFRQLVVDGYDRIPPSQARDEHVVQRGGDVKSSEDVPGGFEASCFSIAASALQTAAAPVAPR